MVVVSGDKESFIALMNETGYQDKLQKMVDDGIKNSIYKVAEDNTLKDLKLLISFLYRNFRKYERYEKKCYRNLTNQDNFTALQRHINLPKLMK